MKNNYTFIFGALLSVFIISGCSGDADDTSDTSDTKTEDSNRVNHEEPYNEAGDEEVDKEAESVEG
jgi:protein involved in sex pheromone biosynthesis